MHTGQDASYPGHPSQPIGRQQANKRILQCEHATCYHWRCAFEGLQPHSLLGNTVLKEAKTHAALSLRVSRTPGTRAAPHPTTARRFTQLTYTLPSRYPPTTLPDAICMMGGLDLSLRGGRRAKRTRRRRTVCFARDQFYSRIRGINRGQVGGMTDYNVPSPSSTCRDRLH